MRILYTILFVLVISSITLAQNETATPTPAATPAATPTPAPTVTATATPTPTPVPTATATATTPTPAPTATASTPVGGGGGAGNATPTPMPTSTPSSDTCVKYYTCPNGNKVQYCFLETGTNFAACKCNSNPASLCPTGGGGGVACPIVSTPYCPDGKLTQKYDANGCITGYDCIQFTQPSCPPSPTKPTCPEGRGLQAKFDNNGCVIDYACSEFSGTVCPTVYEPVCGKDGKTYSNKCFASSAKVEIERIGPCEQKPFCGNFRCEIGEDQRNCPQDCGKPIPQGCRVEKDANGFERYICEGEFKHVCPAFPANAENRCAQNGGKFVTRTDPSGCSIPNCEFGETRTSNLFQGAACQSSDEIKQITQKCESLGLSVQINAYTIGDKTCKAAHCGKNEERLCHDTSFEVRNDIEQKCSSQGLSVISAFDERGCSILQCSSSQACQRDVPKEAYGTCKGEGGELVVKRGQDGCVSFVDCIHRGDENEVSVQEVKEVPTSTELFSIALKLEELRIEFDKLAKQTNDIAAYYKSIGSNEEERFKRVADMFESAKEKVDEIRTSLRNKLDSITADDLLQVRRDIKYIKDVMLKDIVYFMLSTGDEVKQITSKNTTDCGSRGECFDRAFRVCKPVTFYPEGQRGPRVEVIGLEGDACVMKATMSESALPPGIATDIKPPYEMTCKIKNYALGVSNPETDVFPHCTGNLVELIKKFGTNPPGSLESKQPVRSAQIGQQAGFQQGGQFQGGGQQRGFQQGGFTQPPSGGRIGTGPQLPIGEIPPVPGQPPGGGPAPVPVSGGF